MRTPSDSSRSGVLFASGLITGEPLMGILLAIPFATIANALGVALFAAFAFWLYRAAIGRRG